MNNSVIARNNNERRSVSRPHSSARAASSGSQNEQSGDDGQHDDHQSKRRKVTRACDTCKSKKKRCTGDIPCLPCTRASQECTYNAQYARGAAVNPLASTLRSPQVLERADHSRHVRISIPQDRQNTPTVTPNPTSRHAPAPPAHSFPPSRRLSPETGVSTDATGQYYGPTSTHSFLGIAWRRFNHSQPQQILTPQSDFDATTSVSIFSFGDRVVANVALSGSSWPDPTPAHTLVQRYFDFAAPTYRVLHRGTVALWVERVYGQQDMQQGIDQRATSARRISSAARGIVLMIFATASMFRTDMEGNLRDADAAGWNESEQYYLMAQHELSEEGGPPTVESVQARFMTVLYLLSSGRANKAWFTHGTMVQLMMALGLHRRRVIANDKLADRISTECQKRVFWSAYTVDKYLSLMLGRPRLLHDEDIDQDFPEQLNDEDLTAGEAHAKSKKDCIMDAAIFHSRLSQIIARAAKEQYSIHQISDHEQVEASSHRLEDLAVWKRQLPTLLSGAIQATSLVPVFRRQLNMLSVAHFHAVIFVTRPLLLRDFSKTLPQCAVEYRNQLRTCVNAAKDLVHLIMTFVQADQLFPAFWFSQYTAFSALSIIYIYLIQVKREQIPEDLELDQESLLELAELGQHHLAQATARNAPTWEYSLILEGLQNETNRFMKPVVERIDVEQSLPTSIDTNRDYINADSELEPRTTYPENGMVDTTNLETFGRNTNILAQPTSFGSNIDFRSYEFRADNTNSMLGFDFWPQFDSLPLSYLGLHDGTGGVQP
ncbi:fungal-specific transcription factor domain-containing protein [Delphinella strobiligena]|nr:fungal-specific transcription factor domain-containing protein [Delphinella strobiligena]